MEGMEWLFEVKGARGYDVDVFMWVERDYGGDERTCSKSQLRHYTSPHDEVHMHNTLFDGHLHA